MNIKEKTKLHLTESLQKRFKVIQHIVTVHHNALQKTQKPQKPQKTQKTQKPKKPKKPRNQKAHVFFVISLLLIC